MKNRLPIPPAAQQLLDAQSRVISRQQALLLGISRSQIARFIREQWFTPIARGIYLYRDTRPTYLQRAWAGYLIGGQESALGGLSSLHLQGIGPETETITLVVPLGDSRRLPYRYQLVRDGLGRLNHRRGTLSKIRPEDALIDEAPAVGLETFIALTTEAIRARLTSAQRIEKVLKQRQRWWRRDELLSVLADLQGIESNLEYVFRRDVERAHRLPVSQKQVRRGRSRFDSYYEAYGVIVEIDGKLGHLEGHFRDLRRDNEHSSSGLITLRYGSHDIRADPCAVAAQIAHTLQARGWSGSIIPCAACLRAS